KLETFLIVYRNSVPHNKQRRTTMRQNWTMKKHVMLTALFLGTVGITFARVFVSIAQTPAAQQLKKVVIGYSSISPASSAVWLAYEGGFFRKNGLDAQLIFIESGSRMVQTLISGDVVAAQVGGAPVIQSNLQGSGVVIIGGLLNTMDYKFVVSRDITRPDQLKGKT